MGWTSEENRIFEVALDVYGPEDPNRWQHVAELVAGKSPEEVKMYYEILSEDIKLLEHGQVPFPRHFHSSKEGTIDEQTNSADNKAHVFIKMEPPTKQESDQFVQTEERVNEEIFDFLKKEEVERFVKAEPFLVPPKIEKSEKFVKKESLNFGKIDSNAKTVEFWRFPLTGTRFRDEERERLLMQFRLIRDLLRLLLSYPMRTVHDDRLKAWIREASNRSHSLDDLNRLLSQKPLNCFQGLLPLYILRNMETGSNILHCTYSGTPKNILSLAANLAVDQLIQTLLCEDDHLGNIHHVLFSTRDAAEKRLVKGKIESVLKNQKVIDRLHETFTEVLLLDASDYNGQAVEVHFQHQIAQQLHLQMVEGNDHLLITSIEKEMSRKKILGAFGGWRSQRASRSSQSGFS